MRKVQIRIRPIVECNRCHRRKITKLLGEMICSTCYEAEPRAQCSICGLEKRFVTDEGGVCLKCLRKPHLQRLNVPSAGRRNGQQSEAENTVDHVRTG